LTLLVVLLIQETDLIFSLYQRTFYDKKIDERNKNIQLILDFMIQKK